MEILTHSEAERLRKQREYMREYRTRPEYRERFASRRERRRAYARAYNARPDIKTRKRTYVETEAHKVRRRELERTKRLSSPEFRDKKARYMKSYYLRPDVKKHFSDANAMRKYGLSKQDLAAIYARANNSCEACGDKSRMLHIDHDHSTGQVRGILCAGCNVALGHVQDSESRMLALVDYIRRHARKAVTS